jgi:hypothetical protein
MSSPLTCQHRFKKLHCRTLFLSWLCGRMSFASCRIFNWMWPKNLYSRVGNIEQVMALAIGEPFNYPVDLTLYPDYMLEIEYPMDFRQILANILVTFFFNNIRKKQCCGSGSGIRNPGSGAVLTHGPGSGIRNRFIPNPGSRIPDPESQTHIFFKA